MAEWPSGTVTFLFTDLEGSTQRWHQYPTEMGAALARHNRLLRDAISAHGGVVLKTVGGAVCAAFATAPAAVAAALTAQRVLYGEPWGTTGPLRVHMALHAGQAEAQAGDYLGARSTGSLDSWRLSTAARFCSLAQPPISSATTCHLA